MQYTLAPDLGSTPPFHQDVWDGGLAFFHQTCHVRLRPDHLRRRHGPAHRHLRRKGHSVYRGSPAYLSKLHKSDLSQRLRADFSSLVCHLDYSGPFQRPEADVYILVSRRCWSVRPYDTSCRKKPGLSINVSFGWVEHYPINNWLRLFSVPAVLTHLLGPRSFIYLSMTNLSACESPSVPFHLKLGRGGIE